MLGASLGLVYVPCAGPILAAVLTSPPRRLSAQRLVLGFAYALGAASALLAVMLLGRSLTRRSAPHAGRLQQAFGVVMVAVAVLTGRRDWTRASRPRSPTTSRPSLVYPAASLEETVR